jgi:hypothetical protein
VRGDMYWGVFFSFIVYILIVGTSYYLSIRGWGVSREEVEE